MLKVLFDYDGLAYTVTPCWVTEDSRVHYCGAYATSKDAWKRVMELKPKLSKHVAWEDLDRYVDDISSKAVEREEKVRKATP